MRYVKSLAKTIAPRFYERLSQFKQHYITHFATKSYAQEGEDILLARIFEGISATSKFYVDIGAHHPYRFSNTYLFYKRGWRGINVDAMPGIKKVFDTTRPRDITLECGIASKRDWGGADHFMTYYMFNEPALNGFAKELAHKYDTHPTHHLIATKTIPIYTLKEILDSNLPQGISIDFLSVDAEGLDFDILSSNDWEMYRPKIILAESYHRDMTTISTNPIYTLLQEQGYTLIAKTFNTLFFAQNTFLK